MRYSALLWAYRRPALAVTIGARTENMHNVEAMDAAQLPGTLPREKVIRRYHSTFSMYLVKKRKSSQAGNSVPGDLAQIKGMHPDLANPPVYPVLLAGFMKIARFRYDVNTTDRFWSTPNPKGGPRILAIQTGFMIGLLNQVLFFAAIVVLFFLARKLFDADVARLSAIFLLGNELFWRFSVSGLSTMLLLLIFLGLVWCVVPGGTESRAPKWGQKGLLGFAAAQEALVGLGL